ncbi:outer membrane lipoprotein carrier protein LolA [Aquibacillus halophilus]|uniref:Outer membrane lipoprotein carrier protein LolA n=1 Tax=Aquibacillus halophilus TaxID=930132 RepID=A0A6A8DKW0_9BACI|nr:outer membrane lipoprotein carrier protein LolA [Aquibacillus halophilus]MRH43627.1 outer membrane lipoprotein carrier protein LolA [Aquibacillus halophilus]
MRKYFGIGIITLLILVLAACGEKTKEDVVNKLEGNLEEMSGYQVQASMSLKTGEDNQTYNIDIAHKKKDYYRVLLKNEKDEEGSQIILRNDDGVFVLTPALNKSFKFQSEWPTNSSQPYLYQSLVQDILKDSDATFKSTENHFVFETKTNYQNNNNLPYQEIYFDKKTYTPVMVKVLDKDKNPLIEVQFSGFTLNPEFADDTFEIEKNMTSSLFGVPVMAEGATSNDLNVLYPLEMAGAELIETKEVSIDSGKRVILSYGGVKNFTLVQEKVDAYPTSAAMPKTIQGEPVSLGFTMGALTDTSLEWSYDGTSYYLASEELTREEMIDVASSVLGQQVK